MWTNFGSAVATFGRRATAGAPGGAPGAAAARARLDAVAAAAAVLATARGARGGAPLSLDLLPGMRVEVAPEAVALGGCFGSDTVSGALYAADEASLEFAARLLLEAAHAAGNPPPPPPISY